MDLLIIGGTRFVGKHLVEAALKRGHSLTLFHRGQTARGLFPGIREVFGERETDLHRLGDSQFDAVIDTCGYLPGQVQKSVEYLRDKAGFYAFISTISVYDMAQAGPCDESHPLMDLEDPNTTEITGETYGGLKVLCEKAVQDAYGKQSLIIRPGLIVGPFDPTDRFSYWPWRGQQSGEIIAPAPKTGAVQFIDARDLAHFTLDQVEAKNGDTYTCTGPVGGLSFDALIQCCLTVGKGDAKPVWVSDSFLLKQGVIPYADLPLWVPSTEGAFNDLILNKAIQAGLKTRPIRQTVEDTLNWLHDEGRGTQTTPLKVGLSLKKEAELLKIWQERGR